jgi:quercetin dioxygenase-like cupin family protein
LADSNQISDRESVLICVNLWFQTPRSKLTKVQAGEKLMNYFNHPKTRDFKELAPGVRARTFWGDNLMLAVVAFDPNAVVPLHKHPHEQAGTVLSGEVEFTIEGETRLLRSGDIYLIPSNVEHGAKAGPSPAEVLDIFNPVREDLK